MNRILLGAAIFIISISVYSQNFTFVRISPAIVVADSVEIASYSLLQVTSGTLNIRIIRTIQILPPAWVHGSSICNYQNCYASDVDTIIAPYGTSNADDTVSVHFYCVDSNFVYAQGAGYVRLRAELVSNPSQYYEVDFRVATPQAIGIQQISSIVNEYSLSQNYPNPFNPSTKINFSIPKSEYVSLRIYDLLGREVKVLVNGNLTVGEYEVDFDAKGLASGMYYYSLRAGEFVNVKKMVLVK
ncbi:MAG: T9SS type A sorting domain-containing protein [Ignavibacteria bacterium]